MKLRIGFVSNSSSSSYLCVVTRNEGLIYKVLEYCGIPDDWSGWLSEYADSYRSKSEDHKLAEYEYDRYLVKGTDLIVFDGYDNVPMIGVSIEKLLNDGLTLDECKKKLSSELFSLGIIVTKQEEKAMRLEYGDWGQG